MTIRAGAFDKEPVTRALKKKLFYLVSLFS